MSGLATEGACCGHSLNWHLTNGAAGACGAGGCPCKQWMGPEVARPRCQARHADTRNVRCTLVNGHAVDHKNGYRRWTDAVAVYPESDPTLSAEVVREQLLAHGIGARAEQVGGDHYAKHSIQPWDIWQAYGLNAFEGAIVKYVLRHRDKNGVEDLKKARHTLDRLIEIEEGKGGAETG